MFWGALTELLLESLLLARMSKITSSEKYFTYTSFPVVTCIVHAIIFTMTMSFYFHIN